VKICALIVDDEPLARSAIRKFLRTHPEVDIAGECESGAEAIEKIESLAPDLLFLDVQMPEVNGFGVLEAVGVENIPCVIFVTAYDEYAVRAFEVHALDYLLKPFDQERFDAALARARDHLSHRERAGDTRRLHDLLRQLRGAYLQRVIIRSGGRLFFLPSREINWIEAQGNYVNLHAGAQTYLFRAPLSSLEERLDPAAFRRIHRSTIVNVDSIRELRPMFHGGYEVILRDGTELKLSERFRASFKKDFLDGLQRNL
jgi:two-component system, LytTR family, response regulator